MRLPAAPLIADVAARPTSGACRRGRSAFASCFRALSLAVVAGSGPAAGLAAGAGWVTSAGATPLPGVASSKSPGPARNAASAGNAGSTGGAGGAESAATQAVFDVAPGIAGHRAAYTLSLKSSNDQGVLAASGSMAYDVTDACTGWTTAQHLVINVTDRDGRDTKMVSDYATFETKDGTRLSFHTKQMTDDSVTEQLDGVATLDHSGGHGHADFTAPEHKRVALPPGTMLPNAHTIAVLQAGLSGKRFLAMPLFDGTGGDGAQDSFVTIEAWHTAHTEKWSSLSGLPSGRVHVAFYDRDQKTEMPDYEIGMRYFDNGVADDLAMNFGDFVMAGKLDQFELKKKPRC
jgi:hypothetical protein